jgi:hypothetical protein
MSPSKAGEIWNDQPGWDLQNYALCIPGPVLHRHRWLVNLEAECGLPMVHLPSCWHLSDQPAPEVLPDALPDQWVRLTYDHVRDLFTAEQGKRSRCSWIGARSVAFCVDCACYQVGS